jgi:uncharacterized membrane protein
LAHDSEEKLRALEWQLAQLTSRIYRIEQLLEAKQPVSAPALQTISAESAPPVTPLGTGPQLTAARLAQGPVPPTNFAAPLSSSASPTRLPISSIGASRGASPSLESVIGGQWLNRLGIIAVLVGLSYFLKLAIENNWIGPATRVLIGLAAGVGLLLWSERFRKRGFEGFSYSLKALALGILYLSLWAAFQLYHLVPAVVAFAGMVLVTLTSAALSMALGSELIAAFALIGGLLTPVLVSTNQNQEISLLTYLLLLDLGTFWVAAVRGWRRLLFAALVGTLLLSAGWAQAFYSDSQLITTVLFATIFFLLFATIPFLGRGAESQPEMLQALLLLNAVAYFAALFWMMERNHRDLLAWLTFAVAAFYFALSRAALRRRTSIPLESLQMVLAIAFLTTGIPFKLDGRWITFAWDIEAAVLLWLAHRTGRQLLRIAGAAVLALAIVRLVVADSASETTLIFNPRFGLFLLTIAVAALLVHVWLQRHDEQSRQWAGGVVIAINLLALLALSLEIQDYFRPQLLSAFLGEPWRAVNTAKAFTYSALWMLYGTALMVVGFWKREAFLRWQAIVLLAITAIKVFFFDIATLQRGYRIAAFIVLGVILLAVSFFYQRARLSAAEQ